MQTEAKRQERSLSWIVQYAWRIARSELMRLPSVGEPGYTGPEDSETTHGDETEHGHHHDHEGDEFVGGHFSHHGS